MPDENRGRRNAHLAAALLCLAWLAPAAARAAGTARVDFLDPAEVARWKPEHNVEAVRATREGMEVRISGDDPFVAGPAIDLPADVAASTPFILELKLKSEQGGTVEVFYFPEGGHAASGQSAAARVSPGDWQTVRMALPPLGPRVAFRIDPPGTGGTAVFASMSLRPRLVWSAPVWPAPVRHEAASDTDVLAIRSGDLTLTHDGKTPAGFELRVSGRPMAIGMNRSLVGYLHDGAPRWSPLAETADVQAEAGALLEWSTFRDEDGATWRFERRYSAAKASGAIDVETRVTVDRDRDAAFVPALVVLPGAGSFGVARTQAVFAGLEYLDAPDASSSEADITGPGSLRRVPATRKVTFPLMAVCADDRYVGMLWERGPSCSALFDSPDRTFRAGGHAMGLVFPGGEARAIGDGDVFPGETQRLKAGEPLVVRATLVGGAGATVVPALRQYVALRGLPPAPETGVNAAEYARAAAGGWLDSKLREGARVRHAVWPGFGSGPAADAAVWMGWLAGRTNDPALDGRLRAGAAEVIGAVDPSHYDASHVAHVTYAAAASLAFGHVEDNARSAAARGRALLGRFEPDGTVRYRPDAGKPDFGRTHFAPDANGLTAALVVQVLRCASVSGDAELLRDGLRLLHGLDRFRGSVPRGAQTWEVPLHTPDILASAHLVRAYLLGYELTGDAELLAAARDWAWTGLPFVYLDNPTDKPVGPYATVPVFGASSWIDVWFGRPVQWCGLVYADALYDLRRHDPNGPWGTLADGITASGIQQSWPPSDADRQGLLPDFYHLADQVRDGPAINPGTLQSCAARLFGGTGVYDFHCFRRHGALVHAPGAITDAAEDDRGVRFVSESWTDGPYFLLVAGLKSAPRVRVDGREVGPGDAYSFEPGDGRLVLRVRARARVDMELH